MRRLVVLAPWACLVVGTAFGAYGLRLVSAVPRGEPLPFLLLAGFFLALGLPALKRPRAPS